MKIRLDPRWVAVSLLVMTAHGPSLRISSAFADGDDAADELMRLRQQQQSAYDALNRSNPLSPDFGKPKDPNSLLQNNAQVAAIEKVLNNPALQSFLRFFASPAFTNAVEQIYKSPNRMYILYCEIGWFLLFIFFRAWRLSKLVASDWFKVMLLKLFSLIAYVGVASFGIPWAFLGEPYRQLMSSLFYLLFQHKI